MLAVTTHGLVYEDGDWDWVCEELFGQSLPTDVIRTPRAVLVAGTAGLAKSTNGCEWSWHPQFEDELIWDLAIDPTEDRRVWLVSDEGLWRSDDEGESFTLMPLPAPEAKLRSVVPMGAGRVTIFGFLKGQAMAWQGSGELWRATELDVRSGQLLGLGRDGWGNVYGRFPRAGGTDELVRIDPEMNAVSLLETEKRIDAFLAAGQGLMISVKGEGTYLSANQGESWEWEEAEVYDCLVVHDANISACSTEGSEHMWVRTESAVLDRPKQWETGTRFSGVSGTRCGDELPECEDLWPTVALELGADPVAQFEQTETDTPSEPIENSGCGRRAAWLFGPWWLFGRRRS